MLIGEEEIADIATLFRIKCLSCKIHKPYEYVYPNDILFVRFGDCFEIYWLLWRYTWIINHKSTTISI